MERDRKPQTLLGELADTALGARYLRDGVSATYDKPGSIVERLSPEQRKLLETLKPEDIENVRWPRPDGINLEKMPRRLT